MSLITLGQKSRRPFVIYTLAAAVAEARLEGEEIIGRYADSAPYELRKPLLVEFLICRDDPASILLFTRLYGPVDQAQDAAPFALEGKPFCPPLVGDGAEFRFSLAKWREWQARLRVDWKTAMLVEQSGIPDAGGWLFRPSPHDKLTVAGGRLAYEVSGLSRYMCFELASIQPERLRICRKPDCKSPFITGHLRQEYCNDLCAQWGQSQAKLKWWNDNRKGGNKSKPKKERKRAKHVRPRR